MSDAPGGRRTLRLDLEYDGTGFVGWQSQARGRTVQTELARALAALLREDAVPVGAGRTDTGTHALGQVAHIHTGTRLPVAQIQRALNSLLPPDVAVRAARDVGEAFHARYSARGKRYRYRISLAKRPLERNRVWTLPRRLDLAAIEAATAALPGTHSFRALCNAHPPPAHFDCRVSTATWERAGGELVFHIEADRFLRHMVRIAVGTLVEVGLGRRAPAGFADLLAGDRDRSAAGPTAPACGLCLVSIDYDDADGGPSGPPSGG